mgnify:CR=1 FL=1
MSVKRERISACFDSQGLCIKGRDLFVRDPHLDKGSSAGHLKRRNESQQLQRVAKGADVELRKLCRRGIVPS